MEQEPVRLPIKKAEHAADIKLPCYMTEGAAGMDLYAAVDHCKTILPGEVALIPTGLFVAVPYGYELQIRPRSGLAAKKGIGILNSPGTIDSDYRGEIQVIIINLGQKPFTVKRHDRIAQMVLCPVSRAVPFETEALTSTTRDSGGFGHTGNT
ncbi:MAG: dUTP diphosphatase [Bacillota bacterium]